MFVVTSQEMRALDAFTIETLGVPGRLLMENAGNAVARAVAARYAKGTKVLVLAGKGNNGGDGMVAARHLNDAGYPTRVLLTSSPASLSQDARFQYDLCQRYGVPIRFYDDSAWMQELKETDIVIDALLGTGTAGRPRPPFDSLIDAANASGKPIIALDIPSGLDADTGAVYEPCIRATTTVTLAFLKRGLVCHPGAAFAGECIVERIGIPSFAAERLGVKVNLAEEQEMAGLLRERLPSSHKGSYGHVLLVGACQRMIGAGLMAAYAAVRTGAGLVTLGLPAAAMPFAAGRFPEVMLSPLADQGTGEYGEVRAASILKAAERKDVLAIGPGMGRFAGGENVLREIIASWNKPLVLDADALFLLANDVEMLRERKQPTILTPHPGEMARLLGRSIDEIQANRIHHAQTFALTYGVTLVLKGSYTVIARETGEVTLNPTGNPGMATGGTGDVLTGMIASLLAQGYHPYDAARLGVYLHGLAGDRVAKRIGEAALAAGDLIAEIGPAWLKLAEKREASGFTECDTFPGQ